ncbi:MAG: hypothetical protein HQ551_06225 [Desulfobacteraceae bacterium]|nr:hypothetical protein [Desulfobacteraceae bacterium]
MSAVEVRCVFASTIREEWLPDGDDFEYFRKDIERAFQRKSIEEIVRERETVFGSDSSLTPQKVNGKPAC